MCLSSLGANSKTAHSQGDWYERQIKLVQTKYSNG